MTHANDAKTGLGFKKIALTAALALIMAGAFATTAMADDRAWRGHVVHARDWHRHYDPHVVYAPPVVYSAPPEPSPGINLVLPINFH
jgi:hypothetical protein